MSGRIRSSSKKLANEKRDGLQTLIELDLPFSLPIPDGDYSIILHGKSAVASVKRVQHKQSEGWVATGRVDLMFDRRGRFAHSHVLLALSWMVDINERGRKPKFLDTSRSKAKEYAIEFLNRLVDVVRYVTGEYQLQRISYPDITSFQINYWDGTQVIPGAIALLDSGTGGLRITTGPEPKFSKTKLGLITELLKGEKLLDMSKVLVLNAKDSALLEDYRMATVNAVIALEIRLAEFIRRRGRQLGIAKSKIRKFIVEVGLTGNLEIVLKMLAAGLEAPNDKLLAKCKGAIKERNNILHKGKAELPADETENRIEAIEYFIEYLDRLIAKLKTPT